MDTSPERFDVTARKVHHWSVLLLSAVAFVIGDVAGGALMVAVGLVMEVGRFSDVANVFQEIYERILAPRGLLRPRLVVEDGETRKIARVLGGAVQIVVGVMLLAGVAPGIAWLGVGLIGLMVALDASVDFCLLCFSVHTVRRLA